jgi:hypothetical protein
MSLAIELGEQGANPTPRNMNFCEHPPRFRLLAARRWRSESMSYATLVGSGSGGLVLTVSLGKAPG